MGDQAYALRGRVETGGALFGRPADHKASSLKVERLLAPGPTS